MEVIGIIAEYNPFHLGHLYQLQEARRLFSSDSAVVVVMSGCFTQRGEPALTDKWSRAKMALSCGVDLVLELPFVYACASAERFAEGGVRVLQATGLRSTLLFGSECGDLPLLQKTADRLAFETPVFQDLLHHYLNQGLSFPKARSQAFRDCWPDDEGAELLHSPNNILAIEYLKAIRKIPCCRLTPCTIQRKGQAYHERTLSGSSSITASASAIRSAVFDRIRGQTPPDLYGLLTDLMPAMPKEALAELMACVQGGPGPLFLEDFASLILSLLRSRPPEQLEQIAGMGEGLARRLATAAARPADQEKDRLLSLLLSADTRRFTRTRIQRALIALSAGLQSSDLALFDEACGPLYLRVLGFSEKGRSLLKWMRHLAEKPIITKASDFLEYGNDPVFQRMAQLDLIAFDLWTLAAGGMCGQDFDRSVLMR